MRVSVAGQWFSVFDATPSPIARCITSCRATQNFAVAGRALCSAHVRGARVTGARYVRAPGAPCEAFVHC
eukprot:IDg5467t1